MLKPSLGLIFPCGPPSAWWIAGSQDLVQESIAAPWSIPTTAALSVRRETRWSRGTARLKTGRFLFRIEEGVTPIDGFIRVFTRAHLIILFVFLVLWSLLGGSDRAMGGETQKPREVTKDLRMEGENPAAWLVSIFRDYVSAVDGDRCPSSPSCSSFSVQAFNKHGFIMGWLMTVDRLIHEGNEETAVSPLVYINGRLRIYDPVENNDFWWQKQNDGLQD